jgi:hypothetical protein
MIRLFIFVLVRFFITILGIYFVLTMVKKVIQVLQGRSHPPASNPHRQNNPVPKEDYKDVQDAKFVELPNKNSKDTSG